MLMERQKYQHYSSCNGIMAPALQHWQQHWCYSPDNNVHLTMPATLLGLWCLCLWCGASNSVCIMVPVSQSLYSSVNSITMLAVGQANVLATSTESYACHLVMIRSVTNHISLSGSILKSFCQRIGHSVTFIKHSLPAQTNTQQAGQNEAAPRFFCSSKHKTKESSTFPSSGCPFHCSWNEGT